jgi:hypothetical protein
MGYSNELYCSLYLTDEEYQRQRELEEEGSYMEYHRQRTLEEELDWYEEHTKYLRETIDELLGENYDLSERLKTFIPLENPFLKSELFKKRWKQFQRDEPLNR